MFKINDNVKMTQKFGSCEKNDVGRITKISTSGSKQFYLICFDQHCNKSHKFFCDHAHWSTEDKFELYQPNKLMVVE